MMAAAQAEPDLFATPLLALRTSTREILSKRLNPPKIISTDEGIPRDWRRIAELALIPSEDMPMVASRPDQMSHILQFWGQLSGTLGDLVLGLQGMDRFDVIDDTADMMADDARQFAADQERAATSAPAIDRAADKRIITYGDRIRLKNGLEPQIYDAFLLFAEADIDFAQQSIENLEGRHKLKLCLKDRDLVGGLRFEHDAIMRLISERCTRLIVVVSPNFLESEENRFFVMFAQASGIDQRQRKVVPVLYRKCDLPPDLRYIHKLDYTRLAPTDFWEKLRESIETPALQHSAAKSSSNVKNYIKEVEGKAGYEEVKHSNSTVKVKEMEENSSNSQISSGSNENLGAKKKSNNSKPLFTRFIDVLSKKKTKKQKQKKQKAEMA